MEMLSITASQMALLLLMIAVGFFLGKLKLLPENTAGVLAQLEIKLLVPAVILQAFISNFTVEKLKSAWVPLLFGTAEGVVMVFVGICLAKCCTKDPYIRKIYTYGLAFANYGYMGNAILLALFPDLFVDFLMFTLPLYILVYLWGVPYLLIPPKDGVQSMGQRMKNLLNPMVLAIPIGALIGLSGIRFPTFLSAAVESFGSCMSPVAMLLTGVVIAGGDVRKMFSEKSVYVVSFLRLVVFPLAFIGLFRLFPVPRSLAICTMAAVAMPLGLNTIVIPSAYGKDSTIAVGMTVVSHLACCVTIPLIFTLVDMVLA